MEQNPISPVIQEEEKIIEMMEKQEMPVGSREKYIYLPAKRDDQVTKTGRTKYLPIDTCQSYGVGCNSKTKYLQPGQQKRSGFYINASEKLLDGSPGGLLVEMV